MPYASTVMIRLSLDAVALLGEPSPLARPPDGRSSQHLEGAGMGGQGDPGHQERGVQFAALRMVNRSLRPRLRVRGPSFDEAIRHRPRIGGMIRRGPIQRRLSFTDLLASFLKLAADKGARHVFGPEFLSLALHPGEPLWWIVRGTLEVPVRSDADVDEVFAWARAKDNAGIVSYVWIPAMRAAQPGYHATQGYLMPLAAELLQGSPVLVPKARGLNMGGLAPDPTTSEEQKKVYRGLGARVCVIERDWHRSDQPDAPMFGDLPEPLVRWGIRDGNSASKRHGTADLSILAMNPDNLDFGGGIAPLAEYLLLATGAPEFTDESVSVPTDAAPISPVYGALTWCLGNCLSGDIVLVEEQVWGCEAGKSVPSVEACVDLDIEVRELLVLLCEKGVIPILPAGNGNRELSILAPPSHPDAVVPVVERPPGIRVGALRAEYGDRGAKSNKGPLVQLCSWGTEVAALGWVEDPQIPDGVGWISHSGTSAASAIIAGAAAVAQAMYKAKNNATLDVHGMLALLKVGATPTLNPLNDQIGATPNLGEIKKAIEAGWTWPPPPPPQS